MELIEFAQMTLQYQGRHAHPTRGKFGEYLGRGDGRISGPQVSGAVDWDLYEIQGPATCDANFVGVIHTDDACEIGFEALGYFKSHASGNHWDLRSAVRFSTRDEPYACFNDCIGLIVGSFDMGSYRHHYRLFMPAEAA